MKGVVFMLRYCYKVFIAIYASIIIFIYISTGISITITANVNEDIAIQNQAEKAPNSSQNGFLYGLIPLLSTAALAFVYRKSSIQANLIKDSKKGTGNAELNKAIETTGYTYDASQDIFYSHLNAWQRKFGYCRLYDESAAPLHMIIDCEPIYFEYGGKKWLIELWKGQYGMTTGCEVGIYSTDGIDLNIPGVFDGTFFNSLNDEDLMQMSCVLKKNNVALFTREDRHWWLTGFKLGEFTEPDELTMDIKITLSSLNMLNAFIEGLKNAGYSDDEIKTNNTTISLFFDKPHVQQPYTRTTITDWIILNQLEGYCKKYKDITNGFNTMAEKIKAIQEKAPELEDVVFSIGKTKQLFDTFDTIKDYMN